MGHITIVRVWIMNTYHNTKLEPSGFCVCQEKERPENVDLGTWGPHPKVFTPKIGTRKPNDIPQYCAKFRPCGYSDS